MEQKRNEIISMVRSCLMSTKKRISIQQFRNDYYTLVGEDIPFQKLGHSDLVSFLKSIPSLIITKTSDGVYIDFKESQKSSHIANLIAKSKKSSSKPVKRNVPPRYHKLNSNNSNSNNKNSNNHNNNNNHGNTGRWRPKAIAQSQQNSNSNKILTSHNQFVMKGSKKSPVKVQSKVVKSDQYQPVKLQQSGSGKIQSLSPSPPPSIPQQIPQQVQQQQPQPQYQENMPSSVLTKQKIIRRMKELDMNNDSVVFESKIEEKNTEFIPTGDPCYDLHTFVSINKLGEIDRNFTHMKSKRETIVLCKIKIGTQHTYSSYPNDFYDEKSAEIFTCQKALDDLIPKYSRRKSLLISSQEDILERIPPMLEKHQNAVWMNQIEFDYTENYNEQLPANWLQVIDSSPFVSLEKCYDRYVLKYCKPGDHLQKGKKMEQTLNQYDVSIPCNTVLCNEENKINAVITAFVNVSEIWCQQKDTDDYAKFKKLSKELKNYYRDNAKNLICKDINFGSFYVAEYKNEWYRVKALNVNNLDKNLITCFMLDYGEECVVPKEKIYYLQQKMASIQAQAFVCRLDGLDEFEGCNISTDTWNTLIGRDVILEVIQDENSDNIDIRLPVVIYDAEDQHSISEDILIELTLESAYPILSRGMIQEVFVTHIEDDGDIYLQIRTKGYEYLMALLNDLENTITKEPPKHLQLTNLTKDDNQYENKMFFIKNKTTDHWQRATIIEWSPKGEWAQFYFVDYGDTAVLNVKKEIIYSLDTLSDIICLYAPQALKVHIMLDSFPSDFLTKANKLIPKDQMLLCKIVNYDSEQVPWVEFFKQSNEGGLFCINKSIALETELLQKVDTNSSNDKNNRLKWKHLQDSTIKNVPSGGSLKKPPLPEKGEYFNVNVPFAVNPWNFFVQPLATFNELAAMMADMQTTYKNYVFKPLIIEDIIPGSIYASKHEDGRWYRTNVLKVIHSGSISVFYCDFGYYTNLTLDQLVPLQSKYMDLPFQALKAKLAGIKPTKNKWSVDDCETFKNLVTKKQFVSVLVEIEKDELYKSDIILKLHLIDTSTVDDIYIRDELVKKGIAELVH